MSGFSYPPGLQVSHGDPRYTLSSSIPTPFQAHTYFVPHVASRTGGTAGKEGAASHTHTHTHTHTLGSRNHVFLPDSSVLGLSVHLALHFPCLSAFRPWDRVEMAPRSVSLPPFWCIAAPREAVASLASRHLSDLEWLFHLPSHVTSAWPGKSRQLLYRMVPNAVGLESRGGGTLIWSGPVLGAPLWAFCFPDLSPCPSALTGLPCSLPLLMDLTWFTSS